MNTDFRVQVKKFFEKKKKNYILKTVYSKHSIGFFLKKFFSDRSWKGFVIKKNVANRKKHGREKMNLIIFKN